MVTFLTVDATIKYKIIEPNRNQRIYIREAELAKKTLCLCPWEKKIVFLNTQPIGGALSERILPP